MREATGRVGSKHSLHDTSYVTDRIRVNIVPSCSGQRSICSREVIKDTSIDQTGQVSGTKAFQLTGPEFRPLVGAVERPIKEESSSGVGCVECPSRTRLLQSVD